MGLGRNVTFQTSNAVVSKVRHRIHHLLGDADVLVSAIPRELKTESIFDRIRGAALRNNLAVHDISVQDLDGDLHVELDVELPENMTLFAAHERVTTLEADIRAHVPEIDSILTQIECELATIETSDAIVEDRELEAEAQSHRRKPSQCGGRSRDHLQAMGDHVFLSCHVTMQDNLPLSQVHDITTALEVQFKHGGSTTVSRDDSSRAAIRQPALGAGHRYRTVFVAKIARIVNVRTNWSARNPKRMRAKDLSASLLFCVEDFTR